MRCMLHRSVVILLLSGAAAACSSSGGDTSGRPSSFATFIGDSTSSSTTVHARTADARADETPDFCQLIPVDTVAHILQETISRPVTVAVPQGGSMCTYRDPASGTPAVSAVVDVRRGQSSASAGATLFAMRAQDGAHGIAATDVPGLGDMAYGSSDTTGTYAVTAQRGPFVVVITLTAPGADQQALRAGAAALTSRTLTALK